MAMSDTTKNATLKAHLQGTDPSYRAGATQYLALFTSNPGTTGSLAGEAAYTGYARVALTKSSAWTDGGASFTNAGLVQFGKRTDVGTSVITHFAVVDTASGAIAQCISGALTDSLSVSLNIQPQFAIGTLTITVTDPA